MADIAILVGNLVVGDGVLRIEGIANVGPDGAPIGWSTSVPWSSSATAVNQACRDAAIAAAELVGFTIGPGDNKLIFAGAQTP